MSLVQWLTGAGMVFVFWNLLCFIDEHLYIGSHIPEWVCTLCWFRKLKGGKTKQ